MRIGVLALQGAFSEHISKLNNMGMDAYEIRNLEDFQKGCEALVLPGGESTVMRKLLGDLNLLDPIRKAIEDGMPVFGTCAGLILLSKTLSNGESPVFGLMDIKTVRNAYGRQLGSFSTESIFNNRKIPMVFIRAPYIEEVGEGVQILSQVDGKIVAARQGNILVTAFHPELAEDNYIYEYFIGMYCKQ